MKTKCKQCGRLIDKRGMWRHLKYVHPHSKGYTSFGGEGHCHSSKLVLEPKEASKEKQITTKDYIQMLGQSSGVGVSLQPKESPKTEYTLNFCPNCGQEQTSINKTGLNIRFCFSCGCALHLVDLY